MKLHTSILATLIFFCAFGQNKKEVEQMRSQFDNSKIESLNLSLQEMKSQDDYSKELYLLAHPNTPISYYEDGIFYGLHKVENGVPIYYRTSNVGSSKTIKANSMYSGGSLGLNIQGSGMVASVWDGGLIRTSHQDLVGRILGGGDGAEPNADHATHVAGTILGNGNSLATAKGIAYEATTWSYDWFDDLIEMASMANIDALLTSNHSYGLGTAGLPIWYYGAYDSDAKGLDQITYTFPQYLPVIASGNDRDTWQALNPDKSGYELLTGFSCAKNSMTVGAVLELLNYTNAFDVTISDFSNYGPTDDGRIKPDIVAKGVGTNSTVASSDTAHAVYSGTSMAAPAITGLVLLLQQLHNSLQSSFMSAASVKGLILHSASEAGYDDGPDYSFGWGLANGEEAAKVIMAKGASSILEELSLSQGATYTRTFNLGAPDPDLRISISWTDPAYSTANSGTVNPTTKYLVNDLDIKVTKDGTEYYPWKLNPAAPGFGASNTSTNDVDNFERIDIYNATAGTYTITVTHKGSITGGSQPFSLIASNTTNSLLLNIDDVENPSQGVEIYPNPVDNMISLNSNEDLSGNDFMIFNELGQLIIQDAIDTNNTIGVSQLEKGNYVLVIPQNGNKIVKKFIKK